MCNIIVCGCKIYTVGDLLMLTSIGGGDCRRGYRYRVSSVCMSCAALFGEFFVTAEERVGDTAGD